MRSLWRHTGFRLFWAGDTVSQFGTYTSQTVLPLLAIGVLAATPFEVGLLTAASTAAFLLIGLQAGAWLDRMRRRPVMIVADLARAALLSSLPIAAWFGVLTMAQLLVVAMLVGVATVFFDVAAQSYIPSLTGRAQLTNANARLEATRSVSEMAAPAFGGGFIQLAGAANAVLATGAGYLASAAFLVRIRQPEPRPARASERSLGRQIGEGLRFVFGNPSLRALVGCGATANFFDSMLGALLALFLVREVGLTPALVGVVLAAGGVGALLAALTANWWIRRFGQVRVLWLVLLSVEPLGVLTPLARPGWSVAFAFVGYTALVYGATVYDITQVSFRQAICPDHLLGRMNASFRFVTWGVLPLGGLAGGALGEWIGVRGTLWVAAIGTLASVLWILCSPLRGMRDVPVTPEPPGPS
ncbi:MAG: MFS transporter [Pseudonocardiaceae bacterium]|nr:MFS transporter [Pseudonocardiaceae bacterium]